MRKYAPLTEVQRRLIEDNISVVKSAIRSAIIVNENIFGFEYDDLYQEGCLWLCKAAITYIPKDDVKFSTYATTVVTNGLRTYCRLMCNKQKKLMTLPNCSDEDEVLSLENFSQPDPIETVISELDTIKLLQSLKEQYTGTVKKGIEALEWKTKGYSGTEIADMYGVKPNLVGAWISRAVRKLEKNSMFILWRDNLIVEKTVSPVVNK